MNLENKALVDLYIIDASCSLCIGEFLNFCSLTAEEKCEEPIIVIVDSRHSQQLSYYIGQLHESIKRRIIIKHTNDETPVLENINEFQDTNGFIYLCSDAKITDVVLFTACRNNNNNKNDAESHKK